MAVGARRTANGFLKLWNDIDQKNRCEASDLGDPINSGTSSPAERRPKPRKRVLLTGIVTYGGGAYSFGCTIRDLSETGARIAAAENSLFPPHFFLINIRDRVVYETRLVWKKGDEVGIAFKAAIPLLAITDPALAYLKRLWLAKAAS